MNSKHGSVWVVAEQIDSKVLSVSLQLMGHARKLASELKVHAEVILLGHQIADQAQELISAGADTVYLGDNPQLALYQPEIYTKIIVELACEKQPEIILIGSTHMGRELAPLIAAKLKTGLTAHCTDLVLNENQILEQKIPAYGGLLSIICPEKRPQMATVAKGVFPKPEPDNTRSGKIVHLEIPSIEPRVRTLEVVRQPLQGVQLESASVVVAGGAGAKDLEGWANISGLAEELNAGLGSTRPALDEGWAEPESMIGQSGKFVTPELYIGVGLSGEQQHMVGIIGAKVMVAINNDAKSPVFEQVDYGVVEDCREFIPVFINKIREYKQTITK